jgi:hypothetical protein
MSFKIRSKALYLVLRLFFLQIYLLYGLLKRHPGFLLLPLMRLPFPLYHHLQLPLLNNFHLLLLRPLLQLPSSISNLNFKILKPLSHPILTRSELWKLFWLNKRISNEK